MIPARRNTAKQVMKKLILTVITAGLLFTAGIAQKVINEPNAEKRAANGYHAIEIGDGIDLFLSQGEEAGGREVDLVLLLSARCEIRTEARSASKGSVVLMPLLGCGMS